MNLEKLFDLQSKLDKRIQKDHNLENENLIPKKILALLVEAGELANETRCFKFWSLKKPSAKEIILEEYVDCLHFILSIGLEKKYDDIKTIEFKKSTDEPTDLFLHFYSSINNFMSVPSKENYIDVFKCFLTLGYRLGFTFSELGNAYLSKNEINHKRQDQGY